MRRLRLPLPVRCVRFVNMSQLCCCDPMSLRLAELASPKSWYGLDSRVPSRNYPCKQPRNQTCLLKCECSLCVKRCGSCGSTETQLSTSLHSQKKL